MRIFVSILALTVIGLQASLNVEILGKQKARIFKIIKYDFLLKTGNTFGDPQTRIKKVIGFFEEDQKKLLAGTQNPKEIKAIKAITAQYKKLKKHFNTPVSKETIERVFKQEFADGLAVKKMVLELTRTQLKSQQTKEVFYLNNLRAISQKFAITYLVKTVEPQGTMSEETKKQLAITLNKFRTALDYLHTSLQSDQQKSLLKKLEKIYRYFDFLSKAKLLTPTLIIHKSDEMLKVSKELIQSCHKP
jgi:flagellin-specific chaperone FliS